MNETEQNTTKAEVICWAISVATLYGSLIAWVTDHGAVATILAVMATAAVICLGHRDAMDAETDWDAE